MISHEQRWIDAGYTLYAVDGGFIMALRGPLNLCIGRGSLWLSPYDKMREIAIEQFSREYRLYRGATAPAVEAEWRLLPNQGSTPRTAITLPPAPPEPPSLPDYDYERDGPLMAAAFSE